KTGFHRARRRNRSTGQRNHIPIRAIHMLKKYLQPSESDLAIIRKLDMKASYVWIATWLGSGFLRPAPGTWGSLAAIPFGIALCMTPNILSLIIAIILVTWVGTKATQTFQNATHTHDSKMI